MDDNTLQQRIRYLVEHGGVWDDPLADIRRKLRLTQFWMVALTVVAIGIDVLT